MLSLVCCRPVLFFPGDHVTHLLHLNIEGHLTRSTPVKIHLSNVRAFIKKRDLLNMINQLKNRKNRRRDKLDYAKYLAIRPMKDT